MEWVNARKQNKLNCKMNSITERGWRGGGGRRLTCTVKSSPIMEKEEERRLTKLYCKMNPIMECRAGEWRVCRRKNELKCNVTSKNLFLAPRTTGTEVGSSQFCLRVPGILVQNETHTHTHTHARTHARTNRNSNQPKSNL